MKKINSERALTLLQDIKTPWRIKSRIQELMEMTPENAAAHIETLASVFDIEESGYETKAACIRTI